MTTVKKAVKTTHN